MSFISAAVMSSDSTTGHGQFEFSQMDREETYLIRSISPEQVANWFKKNIVPWQIPGILRNWRMNIVQGQMSDMPLAKFLDHLKRFMREAANQHDRDAAQYIYEDIVRNDLMPRRMHAVRRAETKDPVFQNAA